MPTSLPYVYIYEVRPERGVLLAFMQDPWPNPDSKGRDGRVIVGYVFVFVMFVVAMKLPFTWEPLRQWLVGH